MDANASAAWISAGVAVSSLVLQVIAMQKSKHYDSASGAPDAPERDSMTAPNEQDTSEAG